MTSYLRVSIIAILISFIQIASSIGPPKPFNKIEMMIMISRNLEEMEEAEGEVVDKEVKQKDNVEAYMMVSKLCPS